MSRLGIRGKDDACPKCERENPTHCNPEKER